ncbi:tRNA lysidine(34) synthetase TilS [Halobacteriovorax sp. HLS]|uniref:tRNA lysidine(34) synthetase TilS n=1 Tax=Halobacteriovorax sp. HLS TaxID=2234000 RepID=UPI000FD75C62|nr:tRNA lysidine(34) synthetase TilS [Halobacteriovorax sp. HLS]
MKSLETVQCGRNYQILMHLKRFIEGLNLLDSGSVLVGLSAGVDSMSLAYMLKWLEKHHGMSKVKAVHINHGTRVQSDQEENHLRKFCKDLGIPLIVKHLELSLDLPNFENTARNERYKIFKEQAHMHSLVALGHHVDDSFEWSLMQQMKTSEPKSCLGIPVVNGIIRRPLMCLTKEHIISFATNAQIQWYEDLSNEDTRFERNYMRQEIISKLKTRYSKILKNYVNRSNKVAKMYGLNISLATQKIPSKVVKRSWKKKAVCFINADFKSNFNGQEEKVLEAVRDLSNANRGTTHDQVQKLLRMSHTGKSGPLSFSGGVIGYNFKGVLVLLSEQGTKEVNLLDDLLIHQLMSSQQASQIPERMLKARLFYNENYFPPFLAIGPKSNEDILRGQRAINPLLPKTTQYCLENGIWFQSLAHILDSKQKKLTFFF